MKQFTGGLYDFIHAKQKKTYISAKPQSFDIKEAALNLGFEVSGNPESKHDGNNAVINIKNNNSVLS